MNKSIYCADWFSLTIIEYQISGFLLNGENIEILCGLLGSFPIEAIGRTVFFTKEEAEEKLKEYKNERIIKK